MKRLILKIIDVMIGINVNAQVREAKNKDLEK